MNDLIDTNVLVRYQQTTHVEYPGVEIALTRLMAPGFTLHVVP